MLGRIPAGLRVGGGALGMDARRLRVHPGILRLQRRPPRVPLCSGLLSHGVLRSAWLLLPPMVRAKRRQSVSPLLGPSQLLPLLLRQLLRRLWRFWADAVVSVELSPSPPLLRSDPCLVGRALPPSRDQLPRADRRLAQTLRTARE